MRHQMEQEEAADQGFNLVVHHRDEKTGLVTKVDSYTLRVCAAADGGKTQLWERPKNSGNIFNKQGEPIGRWEMDAKTKKGKFVADAAHIAFVPPLTEDQKLAQELTRKDVRIAELEREMASIMLEREKAQAPQKKAQGA